MNLTQCKNDCHYFDKRPTETGCEFLCTLYENPFKDCRLRDCCYFCEDRCV